MSFIFDDRMLLRELLKEAQVAPDAKVNLDYKNYLNVANKMVDDIDNQYFPQAKDPNATNVSASKEAGLTVPDMNTLGNFFEFLARNGVTVDGQRVAYFSSEEPTDKRHWLPVDAERAVLLTETGNRQPLQGEYYVNRDLLVKYMNTLTASASQEAEDAQRLMKTMLGALMDKINKLFNTKLTTDYKAPEKTLNPDEVLTTVPQTLTMKTATTDGNIPVKWKDIQSGNAIRAWANANNIGLAVEGHEGGPLGVNNPAFDYCLVIRVLYTKAQWLLNNKTTDETEVKNSLFVKKLAEVGPTMKGPDGKACSLSGGNGGGSNTNPNGGGAAGQPGNISPQVLSRVASALPLALGDIDFNRIESFFKLIEPIMSHVPQTTSYISDVREKMQNFSTQFMAHGDRVINLGINVNQFANMMKNQQEPGRMIFPAVDALNQIIDGVRAVIDQFYAQYGFKMGDSERAYVIGQIGKTPNDTSIYSRNARALFKLRGTPVMRPGQ